MQDAMRKIYSVVILFLIASVFFVGCKKDNTLHDANGNVIVQGKLILKIQAKHHSWGVPYLPIYLKKDATTWPGTDSTKYELNTTADNEGKCEFDHLYPGNYYIYAHGYDMIFGRYVIGYAPVQLNSTTAPNNELDFILNVSE